MEKEIQIDEHITMRAANPANAEEKYNAVIESREQLLPWLTWVHYYDNADASAMREYQSTKADEFNKGTNYTYDLYYDDIFAGCIELMNISIKNHKCEIGYWLRTSMTGKGIMTSAVNKITELAFAKINIHRVAILAAVENAPSRAVAERAGYDYEATLKEDLWLDDGVHSTVIYAKFNS